jgi:hypothetical protein
VDRQPTEVRYPAVAAAARATVTGLRLVGVHRAGITRLATGRAVRASGGGTRRAGAAPADRHRMAGWARDWDEPAARARARRGDRRFGARRRARATSARPTDRPRSLAICPGGARAGARCRAWAGDGGRVWAGVRLRSLAACRGRARPAVRWRVWPGERCGVWAGARLRSLAICRGRAWAGERCGVWAGARFRSLAACRGRARAAARWRVWPGERCRAWAGIWLGLLAIGWLAWVFAGRRVRAGWRRVWAVSRCWVRAVGWCWWFWTVSGRRIWPACWRCVRAAPCRVRALCRRRAWAATRCWVRAVGWRGEWSGVWRRARAVVGGGFRTRTRCGGWMVARCRVRARAWVRAAAWHGLGVADAYRSGAAGRGVPAVLRARSGTVTRGGAWASVDRSRVSATAHGARRNRVRGAVGVRGRAALGRWRRAGPVHVRRSASGQPDARSRLRPTSWRWDGEPRPIRSRSGTGRGRPAAEGVRRRAGPGRAARGDVRVRGRFPGRRAGGAAAGAAAIDLRSGGASAVRSRAGAAIAGGGSPPAGHAAAWACRDPAFGPAGRPGMAKRTREPGRRGRSSG